MSDCQTEKRDRQTDRQTNKQTDRQADRDRERLNWSDRQREKDGHT